jgi:hypothetical protein
MTTMLDTWTIIAHSTMVRLEADYNQFGGCEGWRVRTLRDVSAEYIGTIPEQYQWTVVSEGQYQSTQELLYVALVAKLS